MTPREVLETLTPDEREAFLLSVIDSTTPEAFAAAVQFGDPDSLRTLRLALAPLVREREFRKIIETLEGFATENDRCALDARRMLRAKAEAPLPEATEDFLRAFALVAATLLRDSKSRASQRRGRLIKDLLDEAASIQARRAA